MAEARPFEGSAGDEKGNQNGERRLRQEKQRGEKPDEKRRRRSDARRQRAFQAAPAARVFTADAAATCSLVRPKRRSRLR